MTLAWVNEWCHCCLEKERIGLLEIKAWINHPNGSSLTHWVENKEDGDCCQWHEVKCDNTTGRVVELSLPFTREYVLDFRGFVSQCISIFAFQILEESPLSW